MVTAADLAAAVDKFVAAKKTIYGANLPYQWMKGYSPYEVVVKFPLEVDGELLPAARLEVVGFPRAQELKFRLCLCFSAAICRLDYTDEIHPNAMRVGEDGIPPMVSGPHYHSWGLNRRFFKGVSTAPKLHNAKPFNMHAQFDSILRWFCSEANIDQPSGGHLIALPLRDSLL